MMASSSSQDPLHEARNLGSQRLEDVEPGGQVEGGLASTDLILLQLLSMFSLRKMGSLSPPSPASLANLSCTNTFITLLNSFPWAWLQFSLGIFSSHPTI